MDGVETEIKLLASPTALEALRQLELLQGKEQSAQLTTTYFDTLGGKLNRAGASLRVRNTGDKQEQTFKQARDGNSAVQRQEWNVPISGDRPDPASFPPPARAALEKALAGEEFATFAAVQVSRQTRRIRSGDSLIELAFDSGKIVASGRDQAISELELEVVEGRLVDALELALALPLGPELRWSVAAKGARAFQLARDEPAQAVRAGTVKLNRAMSVVGAFQAIGWNCLIQLIGNYNLVIDAADNEALHQSRVAIRRLRAALSLFADSIDGRASHFREAFGAAASAMGEARETHVLLKDLAGAGHGAEQGESDEITGLIPVLTARRRDALASAGAQLAAEPFQRLLFEFAVWLEKLETGAGDAADARETLPLFAARMLDHHRKRVKRAGRHLHAMSDDEIHRLRIKVKKWRYAVEFFAALGSSAKTRKAADAYADLLGKLQDRLGQMHDLSERSADSALFASHDPETAARLHEELERRLGPPHDNREKLLHGSARMLAKLLALPPWWQEGEESKMGHKHDKHASYEAELRTLQIQLTAMQRQVIAEGRKLLIIFEGRDTAGKDGTIKHVVEHMSPRDTRVVALGIPSDHDRKAWYFQRWVEHLPVAGEIALFNRSWYNRAGVERVMGFCTDAEYEEFMTSVVLFEQMLVHAGFTLVKYYLDISKDEQKRRLHDRETDPLKQWKISSLDKKAVRNWVKYSEARNAMLARTHSLFAPWVVVKADDKPRARLALIRDLLVRCGEPDQAEVLPDPATAFLYDAHALENGWLAK